MTRSFSDEPVHASVVDDLIDLARRSPAAGNTPGLEFLVLEGPDSVGEYWDITLPEPARSGFAWPGLPTAPVLVLPFVDPSAYVRRYAEGDKARTGLGEGASSWPVPYWWVDGGMASMVVLLGAEAVGLGALFFGIFDHEPAVRTAFGVPEPWRAVGAVAVGHPAGEQRPSASARRGRPDLRQVVHRGRW